MNLAEQISVHMFMSNHVWRVGGELVTPEPDDVQKVIDKAVERLKDEPDQAQIEIGHLIFKKRAGVVDVFAHFGEVNDTEN